MPSTSVFGRELELDRIAAFVRAVPDGPAALLIEGEAGAGKTALWEAALACGGTETGIVSCRPVQSEATLSYAGLGDLIGGAIDELAAGLPAPQRRALDVALRLEVGSARAADHRAVGAATLSLLAARSRAEPMLIAIDDLQWLDRPSARAIGFAFRRLSDEPIRLVMTARPESTTTIASEHGDLLRDRRVERLRLAPLSVGAIERVLRERLDLTLPRTALVHLRDTARGNPLFALEVGRALADAGALPGPGQPLPITGDLHELLVQRLRRLSSDVRDALLLTALLAHPIEDTLARAFGNGWDVAIDRGRQAGVVEATTGTVRFVHPLFATVVASEATERERRDAHRRLADACNGGEERARHFALAAKGPDERVAMALEDAAAQATRRGAPDAAAELAELARSLTPDGRPHDVFRRCTIAGQARFAAGDSVRALEHLVEAESVAAPGSERGGARWRLARVRYHHDNIAASREILEQARLEAGDDPALCAAIDHDLAYTCFAMGDVRATRRHAMSAADLAARAGPEQILAGAIAQVAVADFMLGDGVRTDLMDRARALEDWDEPRPALLRPSVAVAHVYSWADRIDEARILLGTSERELLERGDEGAMPFLWYHVAEIDCWTGQWERGLARAVDADRLAIQTSQEGIRTMTCYAAALLAAHLGRTDDARTYVDQGVGVGTATGHALGAALNLGVLGFLELSLGRPDHADAIFQPLVERARSNGFDEPGTAWWVADVIETAILLGDHDRATALTEWVDARARAIDRPTGLAVAGRSRALLAATRGHVDEALGACDVAMTEHDRVRIPFPRGRTLLVKGQIARRARKWGVAREALAEALTVFEQLGAVLWATRARDELARIGGRRAAPGDLTESERQIADLVAEGHSNREVAEILFLSPRTVSANLARIYPKLGVTSRTEMAARLRSSQSPGD
ncbi:MAG: AAA family ATPase [Acidimicrobiia bacterium]